MVESERFVLRKLQMDLIPRVFKYRLQSNFIIPIYFTVNCTVDQHPPFERGTVFTFAEEKSV